MGQSTCTIDGCERPTRSRGWCHAHYMRWYERGDAGNGQVRAWGRQTCAVDECERRHYIGGFCRPHHRRWKTHGDPGPVTINPNFLGDDVTYGTAHIRICASRGAASSHRCVDCHGPAQQWAYDHTDPAEKVDSRLGLTYSPDPSRYQPMCIRCHIRFDKRMRKGNYSLVAEN